MTADEMRRTGYAVIDQIIEHYGALEGKPANRVASRERLANLLQEPLPECGMPFEEALDQAVRTAFEWIGHMNHPRFFGFIPTPGNYISALADALTAAYTPFCGTWLEGSGPGQVELVTIDWLCRKFGFPDGAGGLFLSGGSLANLTALAAARESQPGSARDRHVLYCSDQTHASIDRALRILGYDPAQLRRLPADRQFRLQVPLLEQAISTDRAAGLIPLAVIVNAGTTSTGAVDPLHPVADICTREHLWLHADAAYGGAAVFGRRGTGFLDGIGRVDSLTLDPHKWLFQPYDLGCVLVRDPKSLQQVFSYTVRPEYMQDIGSSRGEVNFCDFGPELTRPFRALKLWMSLKVFGAGAFAQAIDHGLALAEYAERVLRMKKGWEIVSPATLAILTFRCAPDGFEPAALDDLNRRIADAAAADGFCFLSTTVLGGRVALRLCTIQPSTTEADVRLSLDHLEGLGAEILKSPG